MRYQDYNLTFSIDHSNTIQNHNMKKYVGGI